MTTTKAARSENLTEQVAELRARTAKELQSDQRAAGLIGRLPALDDVPLRIALSGPHNAGKSMLVAALLGLPKEKVEAITGAVPLTDEITPYNWSGCTLLDLPGTQSGLDMHDTIAAAGLRQADLLVLVTSVELPGEEETQQIRHLLRGEAFARRVLVVVNKCNSEDNDPDVVRAEMLDRLSPFPWLEPLFADAKEYVDASNADGLTEEDREVYREDSGIDEVITALTMLVHKHGQTAHLQAVCQEVRRVSVEASEQWAPDEAEEAQELTADRIRAAFADARRELKEATDLAVETLGVQIAEAGNRLAGTVSEEHASVGETDVSQAEQDEAKAGEQFENAVNRGVEDVLLRLDDQLDTSLDDWQRYSVDLRAVAQGIDRGRSRKKTALLVDDAMDKAWRTGANKLREKLDALVEGGVREGSPAYALAKRYKELRGGAPARPYEHLNRAKDLTKAGRRVKGAADFLTPLVDVKGAVDDIWRMQAVKKRQAEIRSFYAEQAEEQMAEERAAVSKFIEPLLERRHASLSVMLDAVEEAAQERTAAQTRWQELGEQAIALAALVDKELSVNGPARFDSCTNPS
ncbi:GTPase [Ornithinimicrobium sp. LYQ103]|uniref:GTPase n=1 Tax=Ornithinimicrobium sp. LYQ103 TaxID=3378796 RepID=UPI003853FBBB